mmetsp:Transcript_11272/g.22194  ORF Transcript_11272/g.22194 Transcript_11272/m.22194 type:complete len:376 (+) Transcript_11272:1154-2281(+)
MIINWPELKSLEEKILKHNSKIESMSPSKSSSPSSKHHRECSIPVSQQDQLIRLLSQLSDKELQLAAQQNETRNYKELHSQNEYLKMQVSELTDQLAKLKSVETATVQVIRCRRRSMTETEGMLTSTIAQRDRLSSDLEQANTETKVLEKQLASEVKLRVKAEELAEMMFCRLKDQRKKHELLKLQAEQVQRENENLREELATAVKTLQSCHEELMSVPKIRRKLQKLESETKFIGSKLKEERAAASNLASELNQIRATFAKLKKEAEGHDPEAYIVEIKKLLEETCSQLTLRNEQVSEQEKAINCTEARLRRISLSLKSNLESLSDWLRNEFLNENPCTLKFISEGSDQQKYWDRLSYELQCAKEGVKLKVSGA